MAWAQGKHAFGYCDRCDQRYPLKALKEEILDEHRTGKLVCPECFDIDHPQTYLPKKTRADDAVGLRNPRPDRDLTAQRGLFGFNPVNSKVIRVAVGTVRVEVS